MNIEERGEQRGVFRRVELDLRQRIFQIGKALLRRRFGAAESLAAPFGNRVQRRVLQKLRTRPFGPAMRHLAQPGVKFLDHAGFTHAQHQLPFALPRSLPAPQQHGNFFFAADERREMPLPRAASAAARTHNPNQRHRLRHAFELMAAALLGDEKAGDLALHLRRDDDRAGLGQSLAQRGVRDQQMLVDDALRFLAANYNDAGKKQA